VSLNIKKILNICFVWNSILNIWKFLDDVIIIVASSVYRTQPICVLLLSTLVDHRS